MPRAHVHLPAKIVSPLRRAPPCRDPQNQMLINLAYAAGVDSLVSGDKDLIALATASAVPIFTPQQLRQRLG